METHLLKGVAAHLDYLHLACGLAWLLFGCMCRFGIQWKNRHVAGWLQLAVFTLAVGQWSRVLNDYIGTSQVDDFANFYLTVIPSFFLLEYAHETFTGKGRVSLGRWLCYAGMLGFAGWFRRHARLEQDFLVHAVLIVPGALATLAILHRSNWRYSAEGAWLACTALGLGAFVASTALLDSFDNLLFRGWNLDTTYLLTEIIRPLLVLGQVLVGCATVGTMSVYQRIRNQKQLASTADPELVHVDTQFFTRKTKILQTPVAASWDVIEIGTRWLLLSWVAVLFIGGIGGKVAGQDRANELRYNLMNRTALGAAAIDPALVAGLTLAPGDLARPEYQKLKAQLSALRQANEDCVFAYILRPVGGRLVFLADSEPVSSPQYAAPGTPYYEADKDLLGGLKSDKLFTYGPFAGRWGWYLAGFIPLQDKHTGQTVGLLGLGFKPAAWNLYVAQARLVPLIGVWLVCLLLLSFTIGHQKAASATQKVTTSERRYRQMFERNPAVMLLIDPETGRLLDANPSACNYYKLSADQLRGQSLGDLSPDSAEKFLQRMHAIVTGSLDFFTTQHRLGTGELRDVEICAGPVDTGERWVLHCIVQDVTERRRAEAELHIREIVLAGIAEAGQLLLLEKDLGQSMHAALASLGKAVGADRVYVYENHPDPASGALLSSLLYQWTSAQALVRIPDPGLQNLPLEKIRPRWVTAMTAGLPVYGLLEEFDPSERALLEAQGVVSFVAIPIQIDKTFWGFIGFDDCHSPRIWSQTEIDALRATAGPIGNAIIRSRATEELIRARDAAEAADRAKSEFLATMSHELRTPMNAVIGMTTLLRDTRLEPRQLDFVEAVRTSGEALMEIINDILDFSKIESGKLVIEQEEFDLHSIVDGVLELLAPRAHAKKLELVGLFGPDVPFGLRGDDGRLRQILVNLLVNGIKFTEEGEVVLRVQCLDKDVRHARLGFSITDTGPGITPDQQRILFQPFTQADSTVTRKHGGTGLGLAICKRLVNLMGGEIGLESKPGEGSTFWFELNFELASLAEEVFRGASLPPARVLVVDRHAATREAIVAMLKSWNMDYDEAFSLNQAVEKTEQARKTRNPFNTTLVENDLCIGSIANLSNVILLTHANLTPANAIPAGVVTQIAKPLKQSQLFDCLATVLTGKAPLHLPAVKSVAAQSAEASALAYLRILVAEDNDINRRLAMFMLQKLGCQSDFACNGREAVETWENVPYDVILMDCHMPVMDGYTATKKIRELEQLPNRARRHRTQIIAMTANAMRGDREKCLAAGMDDYISKPVRMEMLQAALGKLIHPADAKPAGPVSGAGPALEPAGELAREPVAEPAPAPEPELSPELLASIEASVGELQRELGPEAAIELLASFLTDTPVALTDLTTLSTGGVRETFARAAHSLAGSCSIFGLDDMRHLALELEEHAAAGEQAQCEPLIAQLNERYLAVRPALDRWRTTIVPEPSES